MLLLTFLLLPMVLRAENEKDLGTYTVTNDKNETLKSIERKRFNSLVKNAALLSYELYRSIDISNLDLKYVYDHEFDQFYRLSNLMLNDNRLTNLPEFVFSNLTNLQYLNLAGNEISSFNNTFIGLKNLDYLDVSNNKLRSLEKNYFSGIPRKTKISVIGNHLSKISTLTFQDSHKKHEDTAKNNSEQISKDSISGIPYEASTQDISVEVCFEEQKFGKVNSVKILDNPIPSNGCKEALVHNNLLFLANFNITGFTDNWYRIDDTVLVTKISIPSNHIPRITGAMLKSFPDTVTALNLYFNNLGLMKEGSIENMNSLATNITVLRLKYNRINSTVLVANLPSTLTELDLQSNKISAIAAGSFSKLKRLLKLSLCDNRLTELRFNDFQGLSSLEYLDLSLNYLQHITPDAFLSLESLKTLNISNNNLHSFSRGTFRGLDNIQVLDLTSNFLENITEDTFFNMSDTLSTIVLDKNEIKVLGVNSFVKVPKQILSLYGNRISRIETNAFDLPTLTNLNLNWNELSELNGDSFKGLPSLKRLSLRKNCIEKINSDFWKYLDTVELLNISKNRIKRLTNGDLCGMSKRGEGFVIVSKTPIKTIQAGVFSDCSEN